MLCALLSRQIEKIDGWDVVRNYLAKNCYKITAYDLYLVLAQNTVPVPLSVLDCILKSNPSLVNDQYTYQMHVILAYSNPLTPFVIIKHLMNANKDPFKLADILIRRSLRSDFQSFKSARLLIRAEPKLLVNFDKDGNLPIHECCIHNESPAMIQLLVEECITLIGVWLPRNRDGFSPLDLALQSDNIEGAQISLSIILNASPAFPSRAEVIEHGLLHIAARISDVNFAREILQMYPDILQSLNSDFNLPLHEACLHGTTAMISFLLSEEARLKPKSFATIVHDARLLTPTQLACVNCNTNGEIMTMLLNSHPDQISAPSLIWKYKLLHITAMGSNVRLAQFLLLTFPQAISISSDTGNLPIRVACCSGSAEMIELLLAKGICYIDEKGGMGHSENYHEKSNLELACSNPRANKRIISQLMQVTGTNSAKAMKEKLLHHAARSGNVEVAQTIFEHFPKTFHDVDTEGNLPLHTACHSGCPQMIRTLFFIQLKNYLLSPSMNELDCEHTRISIFQQNKNGSSPWRLLCDRFAADLYEGGDISGDIWSCIKIVLYLEANRMVTEPNNSLPILHAALKLIRPLDALCTIIMSAILPCHSRVIDMHKRTALHVAIELQRSEKEGWKDIIEYLIDRERRGYICAFMRDAADRLPLHAAAASGLTWNGGLHSILECNPAALMEADKKSGGLLPFMLAAFEPKRSGAESDLATVFKLLRMNPTMIGGLVFI